MFILAERGINELFLQKHEADSMIDAAICFFKELWKRGNACWFMGRVYGTRFYLNKNQVCCFIHVPTLQSAPLLEHSGRDISGNYLFSDCACDAYEQHTPWKGSSHAASSGWWWWWSSSALLRHNPTPAELNENDNIDSDNKQCCVNMQISVHFNSVQVYNHKCHADFSG